MIFGNISTGETGSTRAPAMNRLAAARTPCVRAAMEASMARRHYAFGAVGTFLAALVLPLPAAAQQAGGTLKIGHFDSPASMSMLEESTAAVNRPVMAVFNNLMLYDQHVVQNSPGSIVPELATSWSWNEEGTELTLPLRRGVKWHDGKPFTAADVKCTFELLQGSGTEKL